MNQNELRSRLKFIKGRSAPSKADPISVGRRGKNYIEMEEETPTDQFDDFFDYEKELSGLESSRSQFSKAFSSYEEDNIENNYNLNQNTSNKFIAMEEEVEATEEYPSVTPSSFILEEEIIENDEDNQKRKYNDVVGFDFVYCAYIKKDGNRCRRQSPKDKEYCSTHQRMINKTS